MPIYKWTKDVSGHFSSELHKKQIKNKTLILSHRKMQLIVHMESSLLTEMTIILNVA